MKHLYIMRHGQTLFNARRKIQGWCDSPLTELGKQQALSARELIKGIQFDHYYSSTSERCCDTLELVTDSKVPYKRLKGLREKSFGLLEGESEDLNPKKFDDFDELTAKYGGETIHQATERVLNTLEEIMSEDDNENVLAVSSAGSMLLFWAHLYGAQVINNAFKKGTIPNCSIMHYSYDNGQWNLEEILSTNK